MVKFENRVALNKVSRFFKTTPLVIFFHCSDPKHLKKKLNESFVLGKSSLTKKTTIRAETLIFKDNSMIRLLKNNYIKKVLLEKIFLKNKIYKNSLVVGNNLCLGLKEINSASVTNQRSVPQNLQTFDSKHNFHEFANKDVSCNSIAFVKNLIQDEMINVLGGVYEDSIIDRHQIKRLLSIAEDKAIYQKLVANLNFSSLALINPLTKSLSFSYIFNHHYRFVALLKTIASRKN